MKQGSRRDAEHAEKTEDRSYLACIVNKLVE
jgi:hypothetical protein